MEKIFENPLATIPMFFGLISVVIALIFLVVPPKNRNWFYGYRTRRAMKDQAHWDFAQKYSSKLMLIYGLASMAFSSSGWILSVSEGVGTAIGLAWIILVSILLIYRVEKAMVNKFGE